MTSDTIISTEPVHSGRSVLRSPRGGRRFAIVFLLSFAVVWLAVMAIHFLGNPDGMFPSPRNPSRRELAWKVRQFERLLRVDRAPNTLVLGSSRMMQVLPAQVDQLTGGHTFNFASPGATTMDMYATLRFAISRGAPIRSVLIGIDDQAMFGYYEPTHGTRIAMSPELFRLISVSDRIRIALRMPGLVKPDMTWQALQRAIDPPEFVPAEGGGIGIMIRDDGYMIHARRLLARRRRTWDPRQDLLRELDILRKQGDGALLYPAGAKMGDRYVDYLRRLLDLCRKHGIRTTVILTPVQPDFAEMSLSSGDKVKLRQLSAMIEQLCRKRRFTYRDLSSPGSFKALPWEWANFTHMLADNTRRMTNVAYGKPPEYRLDQLPDDFNLLRNPTTVNYVNTP